MALLDDNHEDVPIVMPWLDLLDDAPFFMAWHELSSRWAGVNPKASHNVLLPGDSPIVLLVHPGVEVLQGSGEAIAWLETWHATCMEDCTLSNLLQDNINMKPNTSTPNHSISPCNCRSAKRGHDQTHDMSPSRDRSPFKIAQTLLQLRARLHEDPDTLKLSQSTVSSTQTHAHRLSPALSALHSRLWNSRKNPFIISDDDEPSTYLTPRKSQ